jgi:hypothetical protein
MDVARRPPTVAPVRARRPSTLLAVVALLAACSTGTAEPVAAPTGATAAASTTTATTAATTTTSTVAASAATTSVVTPTPRWSERILIVVMENAGGDAVLRNADFAALAARGTRFEGSRAVAHPSQPNYLALVAGDTFVDDDGVHDLDATNVVDLLEAKGITWGAYLEGWPGGCSPAGQATGPDHLRYVRKHDPFISFDDIRDDPARCDRLVAGGQLTADLDAGTLPQYAFYVPDLGHDGHDTSVAVAGRWLRGFLDPLLDDPRLAGTLVVVTYDEGSGGADPSGQPIFTLAIGPGATPGAVDPTPVDHFSVLRTVEENWGLGTLGRHDETAVPLPLTPRTAG